MVDQNMTYEETLARFNMKFRRLVRIGEEIDALGREINEHKAESEYVCDEAQLNMFLRRSDYIMKEINILNVESFECSQECDRLYDCISKTWKRNMSDLPLR